MEAAARAGSPRPTGTTPAISFSRRRPVRCARAEPRQRGDEAARIGMAGARNTSAAARVSTIRPAYITPTRAAHAGDEAEIVADHQDRGALGGAEVADEVDDLGLHRHVERRRRLVGEQQIGRCRQARWRSSRAGACRPKADADNPRAPLGRGNADAAPAPRRPGARPRCQLAPSCRTNISAICRPTGDSGLSAVIGSWKIIEMRLPRRRRISSASQALDARGRRGGSCRRRCRAGAAAAR